MRERKESTGFCWENKEGNRPLGRPKLRLVFDIKMYLEGIGWIRFM
jgi:hypothetical protein